MLFGRELKKILWSMVYLLYVAVTVLDLASQDVLDFGDDRINVPLPAGNYGMKNEEIPELIMPAALRELYGEFAENNYRTYPIGFIKHVKLDEKDRGRIAEILSEITGADTSEFLVRTAEESGAEEDMFLEGQSLAVREDLSYTEFKALMQEVDDILGGGSSYAAESLIGFGIVPISYEEAVGRYELVRDYDRITGGYARLFSDYAGTIALSILPVFLAVMLCRKDKTAGMSELLYTRQTSGVKIIFARFGALITAEMLPIFLLSYVSNMSVWLRYPGMALDRLAPLKYDCGWLLPTAMIVTAVGMFLTELTDTPIAVAVCGLWWLVDVNRGISSVQASYALLRLAPRHNSGAASYFRTADFADNLGRLIANRLLFAASSVVIVFLTVLVYETKRKGKIHGTDRIKRAIARMGNRKKQSEA